MVRRLEWRWPAVSNRLRDSEAKSRIIVLLTDGMNNRGAVDPLTAARVAAAEGVKVLHDRRGKHGDGSDAGARCVRPGEDG